MTAPELPHRWRFFRSGGFDQVRIETVEDLRALPQLDLKLWASLACPATNLEFDERTLQYIDADGDQRLRAPEILAAVEWALSRLSRPEVLFETPGLPLEAINTETPEGQRLLRSARAILRNLGKAGAAEVTLADTADLALLFPPGQPNGDGVVPASLTDDEQLKALIGDIIDTCGSGDDRGGESGASAATIDQFFNDAEALHAWRQRLTEEADSLMPLGEATLAAITAYQAIADKVEDYFMRVRFATYDGRAAALMNGSEADLTQLSAQSLTPANEEAQRMPLAQIGNGEALPLRSGFNPAWSETLQTFRDQVVVPVLGERDELSNDDWQQLKNGLAAHLGWLDAKPAVVVDAIAEDRLRGYLEQGSRDALLELVAQDEAVAEESSSILDVDRLVRFQANLVTLLNNFVALRDFYTRHNAIFQAGRLYLDGRSFDLCLRVADTGRHAALAELSRTYLAYCNCVSKHGAGTMTIVAAVTAGGAGNLMVGRNGVFYDRQGHDWDATITQIVQNPVSLRDAFWSPYRRMGKMVSDQIQKLAASREQALDAQATAAIASPAATPIGSAFDIGKFVGILAAMGLAIGAIGSAFALLMANLMGMPWWKLPLIILVVVGLISGPSMVLAWFKLRARNLAPILDANGWAVNTEAKINIPFGTALTRLAHLPKGAKRTFRDPYATKRRWYVLWVLLASLAAGAFGYLVWHNDRNGAEAEAVETSATVETSEAAAPDVADVPGVEEALP